tara:strand:+ start:1960 stop:2463 length:504 start_codon:yes stop_codon:yes gene_type:complete
MNASEECQELKNIKYKSMLLSNVNEPTNDIDGIEKILDKESQQNKKEPWNKLDKTLKIKKITHYVNNVLKDKFSLNDSEIESIKTYLIGSLDNVKLQRAKDVDYIKDTGEIKGIPCLSFNQKTRKFTLKRCEKRQSTLKSLGNPNATKKKRDKTKRNNKNEKIDTKI